MTVSQYIPQFKSEYDNIEYTFQYLNKVIDIDHPDIYLSSRVWHNVIALIRSSRIMHLDIITSSEDHKYVPQAYVNAHNFMHYPPEGDYSHITHMHLGCLDESLMSGMKYVKYEDRKIDIIFMGQLDPYTRSEFFVVCEKLKKLFPNKKLNIMFTDGWSKGVDLYSYYRLMSNAKIALVPNGSVSKTTFRFYESIACGCIPIACHQKIAKTYGKINVKYVDTNSLHEVAESVNNIFNNPEVSAAESKENFLGYMRAIGPLSSAKLIYNHLKSNHPNYTELLHENIRAGIVNDPIAEFILHDENV